MSEVWVEMPAGVYEFEIGMAPAYEVEVEAVIPAPPEPPELAAWDDEVATWNDERFDWAGNQLTTGESSQ